MKRLEGVIFDLDGTLIHSEDNHFLADQRFLAHHGQTYTQEMWKGFVGMGTPSMVRLLKERYGWSQSLDVLLEQREQIYLEIARGNTSVFPEMRRLLEAFRLQGLPLAIASGSSLRVIDELCRETGIREFFTEIVGGEEVQEGKPAPEIFLLAAQRLGIRPQGALVLEDSVFGVQAALAAEMACVAVPFVQEDSQRGEFRKAHLYFEGGHEAFRAEEVLEWIDSHYCQCENCRFYDSGECLD